jgi:hypothetical protein
MVDARERRERRHLNQGFGTSLSNAFEIALVPAIFALLGFGIDRLLGIRLVFTMVLGMVGLAGVVAKLYYAYRFQMEQHEKAGAWHRTPKDAA